MKGMEHPRQQQCGKLMMLISDCAIMLTLYDPGIPEWYPPEGREDEVGRERTRYGPETDMWYVPPDTDSMKPTDLCVLHIGRWARQSTLSVDYTLVPIATF